MTLARKSRVKHRSFIPITGVDGVGLARGINKKRVILPVAWFNVNMYFKILGKIQNVKTIATGHGIKNLNRLNKVYGKANWRKLKGDCPVELGDGAVFDAEVHWYEGHGIGKKEMKIKRYSGGKRR